MRETGVNAVVHLATKQKRWGRANGSHRRVTPHNSDAERSVLGAVLVENGVLSALVALGLRPLHFFRNAHQQIFSAMLAVAGRDVAIDFVTRHSHGMN